MLFAQVSKDYNRILIGVSFANNPLFHGCTLIKPAPIFISFFRLNIAKVFDILNRLIFIWKGKF